ncbi:hypothetical protein Desti_3964 [Desulfomonile tiedjei DSM 6799]|uniref:Uncharacterized protein n=1 Tax=Desulfomonile tiedjei (strain ATCC 49306 / DSM 6799 / DCB-1) TaxID=706587 RepID=I4CAL5_DESTA|nr:hypothetical protein Desti_3964 [Desulfomonile tiedjei DSM 6799]
MQIGTKLKKSMVGLIADACLVTVVKRTEGHYLDQPNRSALYGKEIETPEVPCDSCDTNSAFRISHQSDSNKRNRSRWLSPVERIVCIIVGLFLIYVIPLLPQDVSQWCEWFLGGREELSLFPPIRILIVLTLCLLYIPRLLGLLKRIIKNRGF